MKKEKKKFNWKKFLLIVGIIIISAATLHFGLVIGAQTSIKNYIKSFDAVDYNNTQLEVKVDSEGYKSFTVDDDRDFKIMEVNDIHIGGGIYTLKEDKKAVYELMSMIQQEKPDLVIICGDAVFPVPNLVFNGGGTLMNGMVSKDIMLMFETLGVYYTITFGNHDTESFGFTGRQALANLYMKQEHCILQCDYTGYGVTNQCITIRNKDNTIRKAIMLLDSNDYYEPKLINSIAWKYDYIHEEQVEWAKNTLISLGTPRSLFFFHIPVGEFQQAYLDIQNGSSDATLVEGCWDETVDSTYNIRIWYGNYNSYLDNPLEADNLFEVLGPDGINSLEGIFVGHDHTNNAVVDYRGVLLSYGNSLDNIAYDEIEKYTTFRGCTIIKISETGNFTQDHKNILEYDIDENKYFEQYPSTKLYYENAYPLN